MRRKAVRAEGLAEAAFLRHAGLPTLSPTSQTVHNIRVRMVREMSCYQGPNFLCTTTQCLHP